MFTFSLMPFPLAEEFNTLRIRPYLGLILSGAISHSILLGFPPCRLPDWIYHSWLQRFLDNNTKFGCEESHHHYSETDYILSKVIGLQGRRSCDYLRWTLHDESLNRHQRELYIFVVGV